MQKWQPFILKAVSVLLIDFEEAIVMVPVAGRPLTGHQDINDLIAALSQQATDLLRRTDRYKYLTERGKVTCDVSQHKTHRREIRGVHFLVEACRSLRPAMQINYTEKNTRTNPKSLRNSDW